MTNNKLSQSEQAYELLKWKILNSELKFGKLYTEAELCDLVGLGRSPIRSALSNLRRDHLVEVIPRKGIFIKGWSSEELEELTDVRVVIETEVIKRVIGSVSDKQIEKMKSLMEQGRRYVKKNDRKELMRIDHEFHICLAEATQNSVYIELVKFLKQRSNPLWFLTITGPEKLQEVQNEHEAIVDAIIKKDKKSAVSAIKNHLNRLSDLPY